MAVVDVEALLAEVSSEDPSGTDLEYEPAFGELERIAQGRPEQQIGDEVLPAEEPDWHALKRGALDLFTRTKDLRVAVYLTRALLHTDGLTGLNDGLGLIRGLLEQYWESVHPQLDPEDDHDPTMRVNSLVPLCDAEGLLREIRTATVVSSRTMGRYSLRELLIATGKLSPKDGEAQPDLKAIDAAFKETEVESLQATAEAVEQALNHVKAIEERVTDRVGTTHGLDLSSLANLLKDLQQFLAQRIPHNSPENQVPVPGEAAEPGAGTVTSPEVPQSVTGEITNREEVVRLLDALCRYYERHEPSSPIPLLLKRAKNLVYKDFMEIIRDLAPDGLSQAEMIRGSSDEEPSN